MRKKLLTLLLAVAASVGTMFASTKIGNLYYNLDATNHTAEVTSQNSSYPYWSTTITTAIIPASVEYNSVTYSVTSIGYQAFRNCTGLTFVTIGNSVTSIENAAFQNCTGLTSVTIPNSVTSISYGAFSGCTSLTSPVYNAHVFAYMPTSYSGAYTIPDGIESIAGSAFRGCTGLTSVTIPNSVTSIGNAAFYECSGLSSVTIGNSVTSIGESAFYRCRGLTSVTIGNSVTSIGNDAFAECTGLTSITCEATTPPFLGNNVFYYVSRTIPVYVPAGSVNAYQGWGGFTNIQPISAESASVTTNTTSDITENSVDISWPQVTGANQYVIEIRFNSVLVCTITLDNQGKVLSYASAAPSLLRDRENTAAQALSNGWKYTVYGLDADKTYTYSVIAKNSGGTTIDTKTGTFKTLPLSGLEEILSAPNATDSKKILIDGQIYILRDGKAYDLTGKEVQ